MPPASKRATRQPASASLIAIAVPATPAPAIQTSNAISDSGGSFGPVRTPTAPGENVPPLAIAAQAGVTLAGKLGAGSLAAEPPRRAYGSPEGYAPSHVWGELPRIAVVYALGECAMDSGIKARTLSKEVDALVEDSGIEAIVFRVDSPGGDAMASDLVAEALKKAKGKKPVIVTQGAVAASGGYWLSMYGDKIVAAPHTITGSIGVIGGWFYNAGLKEKLGMTTDRVQAGDHADIGFGMVLPFLGLGVPDRNLTEWERGMAPPPGQTYEAAA